MELIQASLRRLRIESIIYCLAVTAFLVSLTSTGVAQKAVATAPQDPLGEAVNKYPGLMTEFGQILQRMQREIKTPRALGSSRLLPLLPKSTIFYVAVPNYGDASHQALKIFQDELERSADLKAWWHDGEMAKNGPEIEDWLE